MAITKKFLMYQAFSLLLLACNPNQPTQPASVPASELPATSSPVPPAPTAIPRKTLPQEGLKLSLNFDGEINKQKSVQEFTGVSKTSDRFGRPDQALRFSGAGSALKLDMNINPDQLPELTMAVWVRYTGEPRATEIFQVVSHDDGGFDRSLGIDFRGGEWGWSAFSGKGVIGGTSVQPNQWTFLAVRYSASAKTVDLFVNGKKVASETDAEPATGYDYLLLGASPSFVEHFPGDIDDFLLYGRQLTDSQILEIYEITKAEPQ